MMAREELTAVNSSNELSMAEVVADTSVTTTPEANRIEPESATAPPRWIRPLADYERRETHEFQMSRYG
jgi:hypothetical protein